MEYRILFYTPFKVNPHKGGTERTTISTASGLKKYFGCKCYSVFSIPDDSPKEECFEAEYYVKFANLPATLPSIIRTNNINVVISQNEFPLYAKMGANIKFDNVIYIMAHHFQPGWDENFFTRKTILDKFKSDSFIERLKDFIKLSGYTLYFRPKFLKEMKNNYKVAYEFADATVLLADDFINEYADYAEINDKSKFHVIPNALSYPEYFYDIGRYGEKKKSVLIVSRMDEPPKKISIALRIWKMIKEKEESKDWVLNLVGDGPDLSRYIRMVEEENIKDVFFWGRQIPDAFYENASIFMMTSESEGWGLTLTESQQFGVVPVVFNTSNAFREIIDDGITGILIDPGDYEGYVNAMCILMTDEVKRKNIALGAYYSCNKFSQKKVAENWHELFEAIRLD